MKILKSKVPGFEGECAIVWINSNQIDIRFGGGPSGFFKLVKKWWIFKFKIGKEFHGIIKDGIVYPSKTTVQ